MRRFSPRASFRPRARSLIVVAALLWAASCSAGGPGSSDVVSFSVRLVNADVLAVHLFGPSETFPCCQVPAGGNRTMNREAARGTGIAFRAGRNGEILASTTCRIDLVGTGETVTVTWTGAALGCSGNW